MTGVFSRTAAYYWPAVKDLVAGAKQPFVVK